MAQVLMQPAQGVQVQQQQPDSLLTHVLDFPNQEDRETNPFIQPIQQTTPSSPPVYSKKFGTFNVVAAVSLLAICILKDYGDPVNAVFTLGGGLAAQLAFQTLASRVTVDFEQSLFADYKVDFFFIITNIFIQFAAPRWAERLTYGGFNAILGASIGMKVDMFLQWNQGDDRTYETDALQNDSNTMHMVTGNDTRSRRAWEIGKLALGIIGLGVCYAYPTYTEIPLQVAWNLTGHAIGSLFYEVIHTLRIQKEREFESLPLINRNPNIPLSAQVPTSLSLLRRTEQISQLVGGILPGFAIGLAIFKIKYLTPTVLFFSGVSMGMSRHIDWIYNTKTKVDQLHLIQRKEETNTPLYVKIANVAKWIIALGVLAFIGAIMYTGTATDRWAIGTFAVSCFGTYLGGKQVEKYNLPSDRMTNTLSFLIHNDDTPFLALAILQAMKIGNININTYGRGYVVISCIAYASLGMWLGRNAVDRSTPLNRKKPAERNNSADSFYSNFWVQQIAGKV